MDRNLPSSRILGAHGAGTGPLLLLMTGMHGNEPAGGQAALRVLERVQRERIPIRGRLVAIQGNLPALARGERYIDRDLNRIWTRDEDASSAYTELGERDEIVRVLLDEIERGPERIILLDLHTTSAFGSPFAIIGDSLKNRDVAFELGVPVILGLEENLEGTMLDFLADYGCVAVGLEGGQHDEPSTVDNHEAAIWITLVSAGLIEERDVQDLPLQRDRLAAATEGRPGIVDIQGRHHIPDGDLFEMLPGFENFDRVRRGQHLADTGAPQVAVHAPQDGFLIMPRYQGQGSDGFFLARRVRPIWMWLSTKLRQLRLGRLLPWLPGITKRATAEDVLAVDTRIARWYHHDIFHLFGYRRSSVDGNRVLFSRRIEGALDRERLCTDLNALLRRS